MDQLAFWRNISVVVLAVQCMVGVVLMLALTYVLVRLMNLAQGKAEIGAHKLRQITRRVAVQTDRYATKVTEPVLKAQRQAARVKATGRALVQALAPGMRPVSRHTAPPAPPSPPGRVQQ